VETWQKAIRNSYGFKIGYSLERSPSRIKILLCFINKSSKLTLSDVSRHTGIDYSNVKGIITGAGGKYKKDRSFLDLGLMLCEEGQEGIDLYRLSEVGSGVGKLLKLYYQTNMGSKAANEIIEVVEH